MKKFWAILLAMMLVLSMVTVAGASEVTEDPTPTTDAATAKITAPDNGHTYEILQIFKGNLHNSVLSNLVWGKNGNGTEGDAVPETNINELKAQVGDAAVREYIVNNLLNSADPFATIGKVGEEFVASMVVPTGYYMIRDKANTLTGKDDSYTLYIVKITGNVTIEPKADKPSLIKKIKDVNDTTGVTSDWQDSADYDIGDAVPYRLTATVASNFASYKGAYKLVFHDTMEPGLTFNENSVKVFVNEAEVTNTFYTVTKTDDQNFTVTIADLKTLTYGENNTNVVAGNEIHVEFTATLNENANIGSQGNLNTGYLEFANNPNSEQPEMGETPKDTVIAFTYQLDVNKVVNGGTDNNELVLKKGAHFKLEKKIGNDTWNLIKEYTDDTTDIFVFKGLDDGQYRLTETQAPAGYNKIAPIIFNITATHTETVPEITDTNRKDILTALNGNVNDGVIEFTHDKTNDPDRLVTNIVNKSGATLPETGGIGTTIFYVLGGMMFVGAALILVVRRKAEADEI